MKELKEIMKTHNLTRPQLAKLAGVSLSAVDRWLYPAASKYHNEIPDRALELINFKLKKGRS